MRINPIKYLPRRKVSAVKIPRRRLFGRAAPHVRAASVVLGVLLTTALILAGICALGIHRDNYATFTAGLPSWSLGDENERALIFAPHCDDETLACGGLISRLVAQHSKVLVVFATNGDGFRISAVRQFDKVNLKPHDFVRFGYFRERETLRVLRKLGLSGKDIIFLGYPDRGLAKMWTQNWDYDHLYKSAYTQACRSPYSTSYHKSAPHCGMSVLNDIENILRTYHPTSVYYPCSYEQHTDHWGANVFMTEALYDTGMLNKVRSGQYLVHHGDYPVPQGIHTDLSLPPPARLSDLGTKWFEFDLTPTGEDEKLDAIKTYKSQTAIMRRFLTSFARSNELFGEYPPVSIKKISEIDGASDVMWSGIEPCILDPVGDNINVDLVRSGDIQDVRACYDEKNLRVRIRLAHRYSFSTNIFVRIHTLPTGKIEPINLRIQGQTCSDPEVKVTVGTNSAEAAIPLSKLGDWKALMLGVDSNYKSIILDKTAWRVLEK